MSGERERRGGERGYVPEVQLEPRGQFAPRTPAQEAEERAHQDRLHAESLQLEVEQLGEAPVAEWAESKVRLTRQLDRLKGRLQAGASGTTARADRDRGATVAAVMAAEAGLAKASAPRVSPVEDKLLPAVKGKTIDKAELLDWFAGLSARDRAALWRRYERASAGERDPRRPDEFARALANYVGAVRIRDDLQHLVGMSAQQIAGWHKRRDGGGKGSAAGRRRSDDEDADEDATTGPRAGMPDGPAADHTARPATTHADGQGAAGAQPAAANDGLASAAAAVSTAAGLAHIALGTDRPPDPDLARLRGALSALADALHTHAGGRSRDDERALQLAFRDAEGVVGQLATRYGPHSRFEQDLLRYLVLAQRQAGAVATTSAARHSPETLRTTAAASLVLLQQARAAVAGLAAPPAEPVLHELEAAIGTTTGWADSLADDDASSARRLSRAVMDQHVLLATAAGELHDVLGRRLTRSTTNVVEAYVHALARSVEREDRAQAALERARRLARRQALDLVDDALDQARDANADLAGSDRAAAGRARQSTRDLANRKDQLEARLARGGRVSGAAIDDLVIDAREQAFTERIRALDAQSHQLAIGLDGVDDGVVGWLANGDNTALPRLVSDLHGLGRVVREIRTRYRVRLGQFATTHGDGANRDTPAWIAERAAAIDQAEERLDGWLTTGRFDESLQAGHDMIESAQLRSLIVNIGLQIGIAIVAGAAGRMVARGMGARVGAEVLTTSARAPAMAATLATDLAVSTLGQKGLGGDSSSLLTIGAINLTSVMVLGRLQSHFKGLDDLMRDTAQVSSVWGKAASLGGRAALQGVSVTEEMLLGAAVNYAVRRAADAKAASPTDDDTTTWLLQGASIALGRAVAGRVEHLRSTIAQRRIAGAPDTPAVRALLEHADQAEPLAKDAEATGNAEAGSALVAPARALLAAEAALVAEIATAPDNAAQPGADHTAAPDATLAPAASAARGTDTTGESEASDRATAKTRGVPERQLSDRGKNNPTPLPPDELARIEGYAAERNAFLKAWRDADVRRYPAETQGLLVGPADRAIRKNMTPDDLSAVLRERRGEQILKTDGVPFDHLEEYRGARNSIRKTLLAIDARVRRAEAATTDESIAEVEVLHAKRSDLSRLLDRYEQAAGGPP